MSESNGYVSPFIPIGDGYDRTATIAALPGLWSKVRFRYRPAAAHEVSAVYQRAARAEVAEVIEPHAELLARKIIDWNIKDAAGAKVAVTAEHIKQLNYDFYGVLRQTVYGEIVAADEETGEAHPTSEDAVKN